MAGKSTMRRRDDPGPAVGFGVDQAGNPVPDPTQNVLGLVEAAVERLNDILNLTAERLDKQLAAAVHRSDDLRDHDGAHVREIIAIRAAHQNAMMDKEAQRLDAIRLIDVNAVQRAAEVAETRASALAAQVSQTAEAMRVQVGQAAQASQVALSAALQPLIEAVADLRRAQYEAQGQKTQVVETQAEGAATGMWMAIGLSVLGVCVMIAAVVISLAVAG